MLKESCKLQVIFLSFLLKENLQHLLFQISKVFWYKFELNAISVAGKMEGPSYWTNDQLFRVNKIWVALEMKCYLTMLLKLTS